MLEHRLLEGLGNVPLLKIDRLLRAAMAANDSLLHTIRIETGLETGGTEQLGKSVGHALHTLGVVRSYCFQQRSGFRRDRIEPEDTLAAEVHLPRIARIVQLDPG